LQNVTLSFIISVCSSVHVEQLTFYWMNFHEMWFLYACLLTYVITYLLIYLLTHSPHSLTPWLYSPLRALSSLITVTHSSLSTSFCHHLLTFFSRRTFSTSSSHHYLKSSPSTSVYSHMLSKLPFHDPFSPYFLSIPVFSF